jgi:hypothetical protein
MWWLYSAPKKVNEMGGVERPHPAASLNSKSSVRLVLIAAIWFVLAVGLGYSGMLGSLPRPGLQIILFSLTAALLAAYFAIGSFRARVDRLPVRGVIALNLTRFVGFYFLYLYSLGRLPYDFAVLGGWGDILVATAAAFLLASPRESPAWRRFVLVWNLLGLADILFVVATAARLALSDPPSMIELTRLPLSLLVTFLVPLIIASHVVILFRLNRRAE